MQATYTLSSGKKISIFLWDDFLENETWRGYAEVRAQKKNGQFGDKEVKKTLQMDPERGLYIVWDKEPVYLNEFDYMSYEELMEKIRESKRTGDRWLVRDDDILATFMMESEKVMVWAPMPVYSMRTPFGFSLCGDEELEIPCELSTERYAKKDWHYKITLKAVNEELQAICAKHDYYFSDFCSMLKSDIFALADEELNLA